MIEKLPSDETVKKLQSLVKGDDLIVYWRDACGFRDVKKPEEIYYTPKTTRGAFYTLIDGHLILVTEETGDGESYEGTIIPLGVIEKVEVIRKRRRRKQSKKTKTPYPIKVVTQIIKIHEK